MNVSHDHTGHGCCHVAHGTASGGPVTAASTLIDPVCGMTVKPDSPHHAKHAGTEFRFCSAGCRTKFIADPAKYLTSGC